MRFQCLVSSVLLVASVHARAVRRTDVIPVPSDVFAAGPPTAAMPPVPVASIFSNVTVRGSFRLRPEYFSHPDFTSDRSDVLLRLRPEVSWQPSTQFSIFFQPQAAKSFGEPTYLPDSKTTSHPQDSSGGTNTDVSAVTFHQAYGDYHPFERVTLRMGRQVFSYGDESVIGAADWANIARAFDAIRVMVHHDLGGSDLFTAKIRDTNVTTSGPGDKDFHGLYNSLSFGEWLNQLDVYVLEVRDATVSGAPPTTLITTGARAKSALGWFDYRAEVTRERGFNTTSGTAYTAEIGGSLNARARLGVEYFIASRDYNQLFPSAHRYLGVGDELARRNVRGLGVHASGAVRSNLELRVDGFSFQREDRGGAMYRVDGVTALGSASQSQSTEVGREVDLWVKLQHTPQTAWSLGLSKFWSGSYFSDQLSKKDPEFAYVQFETMF